MDDKEDQKQENVIISLYKKIKSIPPIAKPVFAGCLSMAGYIFIIILVVISTLSIAGGVAEWFGNQGQSILNFFSGYGWQTDEDAQKEQEEKYYQKLEDVYNKYHTEEYDNIEINTTLITATLFYNRSGGDLGRDCQSDGKTDNCSDEVENAGIFGNGQESEAKKAAKFFKEARGHIDILARMMIVKNVVEFACGDKVSIKADPGNVISLAEQNWWKQESDGLSGTFAERKTIVTQLKATDPAVFPKCQYEVIKSEEQNEIITAAKATTSGEQLQAKLKSLSTSYKNYKCETQTTQSSACETIKSNFEKELAKLDSLSGYAASSSVGADYLSQLKNIAKFLTADISDGELKFKCPSDFYGSPEDESSLGQGNESNCQQYLSRKTTYTSEWYREGYYYYKIQKPYSTINPLNDFKTKGFIAIYYNDYVEDESLEQDVMDITDDIYAFYNDFKDDMETYHEEYESGEIPNVSNIIASGPWATWSQKDPAWGSLVISTNNIYNIGCALTSISMLIASSGVSTTVAGDFNPGTFMQTHKAHGGFDGNAILWDVSDVAPNFVYQGQTRAGLTINYIGSLIQQGYYVALQVYPDSMMHWVAVAGVDNGTLWIYDPAFMESAKHPKPENWATAGWGAPYGLYRIVYYKVA